LDFLQSGIECGGQGVPEMEERVFLHADVDKHRLKAVLDVLDAALEDAADDVVVAFAFDRVLFEHAFLEQRDPALEFLDVDDDGVAAKRVGSADAEKSFELLDHDGGMVRVGIVDSIGSVGWDGMVLPVWCVRAHPPLRRGAASAGSPTGRARGMSVPSSSTTGVSVGSGITDSSTGSARGKRSSPTSSPVSPASG